MSDTIFCKVNIIYKSEPFCNAQRNCRTFSDPLSNTFQPLKINVGQIPFGHFPTLYVGQNPCPHEGSRVNKLVSPSIVTTIEQIQTIRTDFIDFFRENTKPTDDIRVLEILGSFLNILRLRSLQLGITGKSWNKSSCLNWTATSGLTS